jgi:hypothetical protein
VIGMVTTAPCRLFGIPGGELTTGAPADLTVFDCHVEPTEYDDPAGHRVTGPGRLTPRMAVKRGVVHAADPGAVLASENIRARPVLDPAPSGVGDEDVAAVLARLATCLPHLPLDGEVVHQTILHLGREAGTSPARATRAVRRAFIERDNGNQAGWLVVEECGRIGRSAVVEPRTAAAALPALHATGTAS